MLIITAVLGSLGVNLDEGRGNFGRKFRSVAQWPTSRLKRAAHDADVDSMLYMDAAAAGLSEHSIAAPEMRHRSAQPRLIEIVCLAA